MASNVVKCGRCNKTTYPADRCERYQDKIYHSSCFKCSSAGCGTTLISRNAKEFNKLLYCNRHFPNEKQVDTSLICEISSTDKININETPHLLDESVQQKPSDTLNSLTDVNIRSSSSSSTHRTDLGDVGRPNSTHNIRKEIQSILSAEQDRMDDEVFNNLSKDTHIVVCGSPRVGKSTLINAICGREVAEAREGLASVTQSITCHVMEGQCNSKYYKYNFWDTPGFESWEKNDIRSKVKSIIEKPDSKPICMIFCASPSTFVDLTQLEWLLDLCINKKHIFCALICTNKHAGQTKSRRAVLDSFNRLLSKYVNDPPREENDMYFYGNIGLCTAVNSEPYETDDQILPASGINELIHGIMESLVDEHVSNWCSIVLENKGFWNDYHQKFGRLLQGSKDKVKVVKKFLDWAKNKNITVKKSSCNTK